MIQGLYTSAAATDGLQTWNDVIARNLAASGAPGFKKDTLTFGGVSAGALEFGTNPARPFEQPTTSPTLRSGVNFERGEMKRSGNPLEFAIEGPGFFRVQRPNGEYVYTRDGEFRVAADGQLVSKQGFPVMGESGAIQLLTDGGQVTVDAEGRVRQGDQEIGVLSVYTVPDTSALQRSVGGFVIDPNRPQSPQAAEGAHVQQGTLELSNVSAVREMVDMVVVSNALQANQRYIQTIDGATERAVQVLGNTPTG